MSKVLFVVPSDLTGGAEKNMYKVASYLSSKRKWSVEVVILSKHCDSSMWSELEGCNVIQFNVPREFFGIFLCVFYFIRNRKKFDYSFTSHTHCNAFISILAKLRVVSISKLIMRESTNVFSWFKGFRLLVISMFYRLYSSRSVVICQTKKMKLELILNQPRFHDFDVRVIPNPVEAEALNIMSNEFNSFPFERKSDEIIVVAVGRLVKEKSFDYLLRAFEKLPKNYILYIIGDGPMREALESLAATLNITDSVNLMGSVRNPLPYMRLADVCVVSSSFEGFPNVLLEMMAVSKVVVSTVCADGVELLPGIITCPTQDVNELAASILAGAVLGDEEKFERQGMMRDCISAFSVENFACKSFDT